ADRLGDGARLARRGGDAVLRLAQLELIEQALETIAVLGEVDRVRRRAQARHLGLLQLFGEFERGLAAELHYHAIYRAVGSFGVDDFDHVFRGERPEIEAIRSVVI